MSCLIRDRFARENPCFMQISPRSLGIINYSLGRVRLWAAQRDSYIREKREPAGLPLYSLSVLFVARGAENTTKCLPLIKPVAADKYLSGIMDPPNTLQHTRSDFESKKKKKTAYFLCKRISAQRNVTKVTNDVCICVVFDTFNDHVGLLQLQCGNVDFCESILHSSERGEKRNVNCARFYVTGAKSY